jgi:hypothetical protein
MIVYQDDNFLGSYARGAGKDQRVILNTTCANSCTLYLLVEAMGHINFDDTMRFDRKGIAYI